MIRQFQSLEYDEVTEEVKLLIGNFNISIDSNGTLVVINTWNDTEIEILDDSVLVNGDIVFESQDEEDEEPILNSAFAPKPPLNEVFANNLPLNDKFKTNN